MKITTKTGTKVTLTAKLGYLNRPTVRASFRHPKAGQIELDLSGYGKNGAHGVFRGQCVLLTIPRADYDAAMAKARELIDAEITKIRTGETRIELSRWEGSPLSGWITTTRFAAPLLKELGIARDMLGWGCLVDAKAAEVLGESFTFAEAANYASSRGTAPTQSSGPAPCPHCETYCCGDCR